MSKHVLTLALLIATVSTTASTVRAADLDPGYAEIPALQETKVEFGSGWYIRGDLGATRLPAATLLDSQSERTAPVLSLKNGSQLGYTASLGAGYAFNNWFRTDAVFDFHKPIHVTSSGGFYPGSTQTCQTGYVSVVQDIFNTLDTTSIVEPYYSDCYSENQANIQSYDVLVNGYFDLGHWSRFTPYVGAGAGLSFGHYSSSLSFYQSDNTLPR